MSENLIPFPLFTPARPDAALYTAPDDVVGDPNLTTADKRAILASWVSDARAVEDAPTLRRLDSGAIVDVAAVLPALASLDRAEDAKLIALTRRPRRVVRTWLSRIGSHGNDDDDPPPAPAGFGIPFRPTFVAAQGKLAAGA
jgi:hypothetical protein